MTLTVTTPAHAVGAATVTVTDASNASNTASLTNGFTYFESPNVQPPQKLMGTPQGPVNVQPPPKPMAPPQGTPQPQPNRH